MKLSVLLSSRARPVEMIGVIAALEALREGDVEYLLRVDADDHASIGAAHTLEETYGARMIVGPRPKHLAATTNELARMASGDLLFVMGDDIFPLTPGWDNAIRQGMAAAKQPVGWILQPMDTVPCYPVLRRDWVKVYGGVFVERFPYWFADTWLAEVLMLMHGASQIYGLPAYFSGKRGKTKRMRDLEFWYRVFHGGLNERMAEAQRMAMHFGVEQDFVAVEKVRQNIVSGYMPQLQGAAALEAQYGDSEPPGDAYMQAKREAEARISPRLVAA